jgi:hypothetical protein
MSLLLFVAQVKNSGKLARSAAKEMSSVVISIPAVAVNA